MIPPLYRSCPHCLKPLPRRFLKWSIIELLTRSQVPDAERVRIIRLLFPEDTEDEHQQAPAGTRYCTPWALMPPTGCGARTRINVGRC